MTVRDRLRFELNEIISFFVERTWGYPIALFRILYGLLATWTSGFLYPNYVRYYTDAGRMPWSKVRHFPEHVYSVVALNPTSAGYVYFLISAQLLASLLLTVGLFSRVSAFVIFAVQVAFQHRNPYVLNSGDHLFLICAFLLLFVPAEHRFSLRNVVERRFFPAKAAERRRQAVSVWSTRLVGLQICYVYLFAFAAKMNSPTWLAGTAMYDVFASPSLARWPAEIHQPVPLALITWGTLLFELAFPLLVWQKPFRKYIIPIGILFHLGIEISMVLPMFSWLMMFSYAVFLDDSEAQAVLRFPLRLFGVRPTIEPPPEDVDEAADAASRAEPIEIQGVIKDYSWGSRDEIASRLNRAPSGAPEAEYWLGAHPAGPAMVVTSGDSPAITLADWIQRDPVAQLGPVVSERFGGKLPFLFKVLSAHTPLSIQVHPSAEQAQRGFDRERARGIEPSDSRANYRDAGPKPELLYALSPFRALYGFCPLSEAMARFERLVSFPEGSELAALVGRARELEEADFRRQYVRLALGLPAAQAAPLLAELKRRAAEAHRQDPSERWLADLVQIAGTEQADQGLLVVLLMNFLELQPGQAIFLPARKLHAYLGGTGLEVMSASDNVLRGGLTTKHVDVDELCEVAEFGLDVPELLSPERVIAPADGGNATSVQRLRTEATSFELQLAELGPGDSLPISGPAVVLVLRGGVAVGALPVSGQGKSWFFPHAEAPWRLEGDDPSSLVALVTVPA